MIYDVRPILCRVWKGTVWLVPLVVRKIMGAVRWFFRWLGIGWGSEVLRLEKRVQELLDEQARMARTIKLTKKERDAARGVKEQLEEQIEDLKRDLSAARTFRVERVENKENTKQRMSSVEQLIHTRLSHLIQMKTSMSETIREGVGEFEEGERLREGFSGLGEIVQEEAEYLRKIDEGVRLLMAYR